MENKVNWDKVFILMNKVQIPAKKFEWSHDKDKLYRFVGELI